MHMDRHKESFVQNGWDKLNERKEDVTKER